MNNEVLKSDLEIEQELAERNLNAVAILLYVETEGGSMFTEIELSQLIGMTKQETLDALHDLQTVGWARFIARRQEWCILKTGSRPTGGYQELDFSQVGWGNDLEFAYQLNNAIVH